MNVIIKQLFIMLGFLSCITDKCLDLIIMAASPTIEYLIWSGILI